VICLAPPSFDPVSDAPINHRVAVIEKSSDPCPLHWVGELIGVDVQPDGEVCWCIVDDSGVTLSLPYSQITDWEVEDVRLVRGSVI
jgi:hypothetical protein